MYIVKLHIANMYVVSCKRTGVANNILQLQVCVAMATYIHNNYNYITTISLNLESRF